MHRSAIYFLVAVFASLVLRPCVVQAESPEEDLYRRFTGSAPTALGDAAPAHGMAASASRAACIGDPKNLETLEDRIAWNERLARCADRSSGAASVAAWSDSSLAVDATKRKEELEAQQEFVGLNWGAGFGLTYRFDDAIDEAVVVGDKVRVTKDETLQPRLLLESHLFAFGHDRGRSGKRIDSANGPFLAIASDGEDAIAGIGGGWMFGWRDQEGSGAFTLGLGVMVDRGVKTLGDGIREGEALPAGETEIRYEERSRAAALVLVTRTF